MESEVIVIEDTPPTSPKKAVKNINIIRNRSSQNMAIPTSTTYALPGLFADNINRMNLTENNNNKITYSLAEKETPCIDPDLRKDLQNRGVVIRSLNGKSTDNNIVDINGTTKQITNNSDNFHPTPGMPVYFSQYENYSSSQTKNITTYCDNFTNVKFDENYQFLSQSFLQPSFYNTNDNYNMQCMPEFIDINTFMSYNNFGAPHFMTSDNLLEANKIYQTTECETKTTKNNKKDKDPVPLFLKRNRANMKVIDLSTDDLNEVETDNTKQNEEESNDDDLEIVYVGAYAREHKYQTLPHTVYKLPALEEEKENIQLEISRQSPISISDSTSDNQNSQEGSSDDRKGKRKRKPTLTVPRRNPKRQVQIEKDYLKLLDNVICESKKEARHKKVKRSNKSSTDGKKSASASIKKGTRQVTNVGAIYRPPSPLSIRHLRDWPESGMHERPEYNPVTNLLEPFDIIIRNLSVNFTQSTSKIQLNVPENSTERKELKWICHEMLHHVLAYGATVKSLLKQEKEEDKVDFLKDLALESLTSPLNLTKSNRVVLYDTETKEEKDKILSELKDVIGNSILLYSMTNEVDRNNLGSYIESLNPEEIIDWSNKQLKIVE